MRGFMRFLAVLFGLSGSVASAQEPFSRFTQNVALHVIAHEMGHAMLREFDLPILGTEEDIAEDFATVYIHLMLPDRAEEIFRDRAHQHMADDAEAGMFSEYRDDRQRAGRIICLAYGMEPERYEGLAATFGLEGGAAATCRDLAPEVLRSWRRIIDAYRMPEDARVTELRITGDPGTQPRFEGSDFVGVAYTLLSSINWHSLITLNLNQCDGTAGWSRREREIEICEDYLDRFEEQGRALR